jgi:AraC-like DNA-binding protein
MNKRSDDNLLASWQVSAKESGTAIVLPDGCRDVIMKVVNNDKPQWLISPLYDHAQTVSIDANSTLAGFRLRPGVNIAQEKLLSVLHQNDGNVDDISTLLFDYTAINCSVEEALNCLATDVGSVKQAASELGVSSRTLQRLIVNHTNKSPTYWILLARARRAARALTQSMPLAQIADFYGYADQSHMNREMKRWFNATPFSIRTAPNSVRQLYSKGYD